jgi:CubicO group peptidase (beta-lactamase class C family)
MPRTENPSRLRSIPWVLAALFVLSAVARAADPEARPVPDPSAFDSLPALVQSEIEARRIPGAVVLIGNKENVLYRRAFGFKVLNPEPVPLTLDTVFDLASVTKVVATTPAVMQLVEHGNLKLDDPVAKYWPEFAKNGKGAITVRDLLTHYSGLPADLDLSQEWSGYDTAMRMIVATKPAERAGERYRYSDINFEILGELIRRVAGSPLDR